MDDSLAAELPSAAPATVSEPTGLEPVNAPRRGDRIPPLPPLRDARGRPVEGLEIPTARVLTFFTTRCPPDLCPAVVDRLAAAARRLRPDLLPRVRFLAVTLDPEHDRPSALRAFGRTPALLAAPEAGAPERWWEGFGVVTWPREDGTLGHSLDTLVIDDDGVVMASFGGVDGWGSDDIVATVVSILDP